MKLGGIGIFRVIASMLHIDPIIPMGALSELSINTELGSLTARPVVASLLAPTINSKFPIFTV